MSEDNRNRARGGGNEADKAEDNRKTRSIRFSESERDEVRRAALAHDLPVSELVGERILALVRAPESVRGYGVTARPIQQLFRSTWWLAI